MRGIKTSKTVNGRSEFCTNCPIKRKSCEGFTSKFKEVCSNAFIEATEGSKKDLWHTSDKIPKKNRPLLLQLSNGMLVFGKFEGWGIHFPFPNRFTK
jgi:hypothetical protein